MNKKLVFGGLLVVALVSAGALAYTQGAVPGIQGGGSDGPVEAPSFGITDYGDWGAVGQDEIEVVHTLWIDNPNPAGVSIGDAITVEYQATINDVDLASGQKEGFSIQNGNNTVEVTTVLATDKVVPWWVNFVENDETITYRLQSQAEVRAGLSYRADLPEQTGQALTDQTPVESALDQAASEVEGRYTCEVGATGEDACFGQGAGTGTQVGTGQTAGVEVVDGSAEWGRVTEEQTTILFDFQVENVGDVPVVLDLRHLGASVSLNDNDLLRATGQDHTVRGVSGDAVLLPGQTRNVTYVVTMDNSRVDDWFKSHVRRDELSDVQIQLQLVFGIEDTDLALRVPTDGGVQYDCQLQTAILEDDQTSETTCGSGGQVRVGPVDVGIQELEQGTATTTPTGSAATPTPTATPEGSTETDTPSAPTETPTPTGTPDGEPRASASASPESGEAPLTVTLDASDSTDSDGEIVEYTWRRENGVLLGTGETVEREFVNPGTYDVTVTVADDDGNTDTDTVTVTSSAP